MTDDQGPVDQDDVSELLDGDVLGEEPGDDELPGLADYPPEHSLGVEDPTLIGDDDVATRELRAEVTHREEGTGVELLAPEVGESGLDEEAQEVADAVEARADELSAEEAAIHIVDEIVEE